MGVYRVDAVAFDEGLRPLPRRSLRRGAPRLRARRSGAARPATQYYIAYAFLREGWGRVYADDALYRQAQIALQRALAPRRTVSCVSTIRG